VTLPVLLGTTVTVLVWTVLQVLLLAIALGSADYTTGRTTAVSPTGYTVLSAAVAATGVGAGAAASGRLLLLRDVSPRAAQRVAVAQSAVVTAVVVLHGLLAAHAAMTAVAVLIAGAAAGGLLGAALGTRARRGARSRGARSTGVQG
jgi:hypothetical protein